jgi:hypothetical protein
VGALHWNEHLSLFCVLCLLSPRLTGAPPGRDFPVRQAATRTAASEY